MCKTALKKGQVLAEENLSTDYSADTRLRFLGESQCQDDCRGCREFSVRHVVAGGRLPRLHWRDPGADAAAYHVVHRKECAVWYCEHHTDAIQFTGFGDRNFLSQRGAHYPGRRYRHHFWGQPGHHDWSVADCAGFGLKVDIDAYAMPLLAFGVILIFQSSKSLKGIGYILAGMGFLFLGIHYMKEGFETFKETINLAEYAVAGYPMPPG